VPDLILKNGAQYVVETKLEPGPNYDFSHVFPLSTLDLITEKKI